MAFFTVFFDWRVRFRILGGMSGADDNEYWSDSQFEGSCWNKKSLKFAILLISRWQCYLLSRYTLLLFYYSGTYIRWWNTHNTKNNKPFPISFSHKWYEIETCLLINTYTYLINSLELGERTPTETSCFHPLERQDVLSFFNFVEWSKDFFGCTHPATQLAIPLVIQFGFKTGLVHPLSNLSNIE